MKKVLILCFSVCLASCSKQLTNVTSVYAKKSDVNDTTATVNREDLMGTQIYLQGDFTLTREIGDGEKDVKPERIRIINGKKVEEILFQDGLKVVIENFEQNVAMVRFEESCDCNVRFGPDNAGLYKLMFVEKKLSGKTEKMIEYDGKWWVVKYSSQPKIQFNLIKEKKVKKEIHTAEGVKLK